MLELLNRRRKSWTYWLAGLTALSAQLPAVRDLLGEYYGATGLVIAVLIALLREKTNRALSEK